MRNTQRFIAFLTTSLLVPVVGCSGGSKADRETTVAAQVEPTPPSDVETTTSTLALCTGEVPIGATHCLLDLGEATDTYWDDTDGVAPGAAGCHIEYEEATCQGIRSGREFGEFCLDADRLVESNPGVDECHTHADDRGKPDVFSCLQWCQEQGATGGSCEGGVPVQAGEVSCESARCVCATTG